MQSENKIKVWDPLVRVFHWTLVSAFFIAYFTEEDFLSLHVWAGYTVLAAILIRLVWGFVGSRHAKFSDFVTSPRVAFTYLKDTLMLKAKRYIGHNPAGGLMIIAILVSLLITTVTGIAVYGAEEHAGPMATWFSQNTELWESVWEETHEFFANFTLFLVIVHVGGVMVESLIHKENLVKAMWDGLKRRELSE